MQKDRVLKRDLFKTIGISFAISMDGELVMKGGIGLADVENGTLMTSETILRIASISKSFTSVAVGKFVYRGCRSGVQVVAVHRESEGRIR